jgi:hypothetical protein
VSKQASIARAARRLSSDAHISQRGGDEILPIGRFLLLALCLDNIFFVKISMG